MRTKSKIQFSSAASLAISVMVAFLVLSTLGDIDRESKRIQHYVQIRQKTEALNLLTSRLPFQAGEDLIRQIEVLQTSLGDLLSGLRQFDNQEELLVRQIEANTRNLGYAIEKLVAATRNPAGSSAEQYTVLVSHLWMIIQFISDDTRHLMELSQNDIDAAKERATGLILTLFAGLVIMIAAISFFSGKSIIRAQQALHAALAKAEAGDRLLRALMDHVPEGISITDGELNLKMVSRHGQDLLGIYEMMPLEEVARDWKVYRSDGITPMPFEDLPVVRAVHRGEIVKNVELTQLNKSGIKLPLLCTAGPIRDAAGNVTGAIVAWRDITDIKSSQQAMRETKERLQLALSASRSFAWSWNLKEDIVSYSESAGQLLGWPEARPIDSVWQAVHPDDVDSLRKEVEGAIEERGYYEIDFRVIRPDNRETMWLRSRARVECDLSGDPVGVSGIDMDVTERKQTDEALLFYQHQLETEKRNLEAILQSLPVGVVVTDANGGILLTNNMDDNIWGPRPVTKGVDDYVQYKAWWADSGKPVEPHEWASALAVQKGHPIYGQVLKIERSDGRFGYVYNSAVPIRDAEDRIVGSAAAIQDITDLRISQEALRQLNENLEQQVAERTELAEVRAKQLQSLAVELIEAEERERKRIADILHEDLQQILAAARLQLQAVCANPLPEPMANVMQLLEESIAKSRRLSQELCPPALYHTGLPAALNWLARQMLERFGLQAQMEFEIPETIENSAFKVFIFRTVQELLFNVAKHSGVNSARVVLTSSEDGIVLTVSDQGRGFGPDIIEKSTSTLGLGLLSIRERASYIGGSFEIESSPDRGSRVSLKLPLVSIKSDSPAGSVQTEPPDSTSEIAGHLGKKAIRVVFADDHKVMRQGLIRLISGQPDIQVVGEAANGREAIELSRQLRPDVVVMDVSMPIVGGIEATGRIKAEMPGIRIIGLSMFDDEQTTALMRDAGADAFVKKAGSVADILVAIYGKDRTIGNKPNAI